MVHSPFNAHFARYLTVNYTNLPSNADLNTASPEGDDVPQPRFARRADQTHLHRGLSSLNYRQLPLNLRHRQVLPSCGLPIRNHSQLIL